MAKKAYIKIKVERGSKSAECDYFGTVGELLALMATFICEVADSIGKTPVDIANLLQHMVNEDSEG